MKEIEKIMEDSKLKTKLGNNEFIDPEEFLNESVGEEYEQNNMKSLYLTEHLSINTRNLNNFQPNNMI